MATTIQALAATMLSGVGTRRLIALSFILLIGLGLVMRLDINPFHGYVIGFMFWKLIDEDFRTRLIDIRWIFCLAVMSMFAMKNIPDAALSAFAALLLFDTVRLATCKTIYVPRNISLSKGGKAVKETEKKTIKKGKRYGYIPFLMVAFILYVWYMGLIHPDIPWFIEPTSRFLSAAGEIAVTYPVLAVSMFMVIMSVNIILRLKISADEKSGMEIIPGFGAGDPPVLATISILLGIQETLLVFFISLLISLPIAFIQERSRSDE